MIVKQGEIRANIKKYFDMAYEGEYIVVPRKDNKNVVIISEESFEQMRQTARLESYAGALPDMVSKSRATPPERSDIPKIESYPETSDIKSNNMDRLMVFRGLKDGWNGHDAKAFDPKLIDKVEDILKKQDIQPEIFPSALGVIGFEYSNSRRDFMSIDVGLDKKAEVFLVMYNGQEITEYIDADADAIKKRVKEFYE